MLYGGAAGGGKTSALLMAAAQYVETPGYAALILRESFRDLVQPDALIPRSKTWWYGKAQWSSQLCRWTFPSGATITFGYLSHDDDVHQYQGAAYQAICIDELGQHSEFRYRYLFSRLRKPNDLHVPLRMRSTANPGGKGSDWIKNRFIKPPAPDPTIAFVAAKLADNPALNYAEYVASLAHLDPLTRAQLLDGDWDAHADGRFKPSWFVGRWTRYGTGWVLRTPGQPERYAVLEDCWLFLTCDPAASVKDSADYTVICAWAVTQRNDLIWLDTVRFRAEIPDILPRVQAVWDRWQVGNLRNVPLLKFVGIEAVASNCAVYQAARRTKMVVRQLTPGGKDKLVRATPFMNLAADHRVWLPAAATWLEDATAELFSFTGDDKVDANDDTVDCASYAGEVLMHANPSGCTGKPFTASSAQR